MDPIADMINGLKNAARANKVGVAFPASNIKFEIAKLLETQGFIKNVNKAGKKTIKQIQCELVYQDKAPKILGVKRISKPSRRVYVKVNDLKSLGRGRGLAIVSTPQGLKTAGEALAAKTGGELLFTIWS